MTPSVLTRLSAVAPTARARNSDASVIASHVSALGRWIEMLQAQGVNQYDDGLMALTRRQRSLEEQQRKYGLAD